MRLNAVEAAIVHLAESPVYVARDDVGLNGQRVRKQIFTRLGHALPFEVVIETGTWMGDTTGYLAETLRLPVYSCELHRVPHAIAKLRLARLRDIRLVLKDSRAFLRDLAATIPATTTCLFYLDAHWHSDLPLAEELRIIAKAWKEYVVVVDDFSVPGDAGYGYDSYGRGKTLEIADFSDEFSKNGLIAFFPVAPSNEESGFKRGCVVLAPRGPIADRVAGIDLLRRD